MTASKTSPAEGPVEAGSSPAVAAIDVRRLAHELRTPLSAIAAMSEIIRDERLGPVDGERYRGYAAGIHESAGHAMSVLASFLEPGTPTRPSGLPTQFEELDVGADIASLAEALRPLAERAGVELALERPERLPHLIADRRSLRQILENLVSNGLKATPPGGRIAIRVRYAAGGPVVIEVADTGDGMTATELARARAGATAPAPLRLRSGGTGYGLPLVHALAAACGGAIAVDSELRAGTRVTIAFPHDRVVPV